MPESLDPTDDLPARPVHRFRCEPPPATARGLPEFPNPDRPLVHASPGVRVERFRPQQDVMPHADAVIGHGGFGTTMTALAGGVPRVVVPLFALDQFHNARAVERAGADAVTDTPA
ncbi:glycosyltransferase [Saccharothrix isguenensis]